MDSKSCNNIVAEHMMESDRKRISNFIEEKIGIKMPPAKKVLLEGRLSNRLRLTKFKTYHDYFDYVFSEEGEKKELINLINAVSTNKTDFFREKSHFEYLQSKILPEKTSFHSEYGKNSILLWSAASSSGEEAYSLAMVVDDFLVKSKKTYVSYGVLATDISTKVLNSGINAIYDEKVAEPIPYELRKRYCLRGKNSQKHNVKIVREIRKRVQFYHMNLMDPIYHIKSKFDVIFCRNVFIYFKKDTQEKIVNKLGTFLKPGGYLFIGHSETLMGIRHPFKMVKPSVYQL